MESKDQIAQAAEKLFLLYGIRSVTMDDISKEISISKKTIYQHYRDKDEMVCMVTERVLNRDKKEFDTISASSIDAIHAIVMVSQYLRDHLKSVNPSILYDLQKYHPSAWNIYLHFKENVFLQSLRSTLERGIKEGFFRIGINIEVLAHLRIEEIQMCSNTDIFPREKFDYKEVQLQLFNHFIHGVLTDKGRQKLDTYLEKVGTNEI